MEPGCIPIDTTTSRACCLCLSQIATPTTLKSIQLKFLELLSQISDVNRPRVPEMVNHVEILAKVLGLFKQGVLLMDEVDVILHPLKSELNFPVGEKHDLDANPWRWELPVHIIDCIFFAKRKKMAVDFGESAKARGVLDALQQAIDEGVEIRALQETPHISETGVSVFSPCICMACLTGVCMYDGNAGNSPVESGLVSFAHETRRRGLGPALAPEAERG